MKVTKTEFGPITEVDLSAIVDGLRGVVRDVEVESFRKYAKPRQTLSSHDLDDVFLYARVTVEGSGNVVAVHPNCSVDQEEWWLYEDEPAFATSPLYLHMDTVLPSGQISIDGEASIFVLFRSDENIWDRCKGLSSRVWDMGKFEVALSVDLELDDGTMVSGQGVAASQVVTI